MRYMRWQRNNSQTKNWSTCPSPWAPSTSGTALTFHFRKRSEPIKWVSLDDQQPAPGMLLRDDPHKACSHIGDYKNPNKNQYERILNCDPQGSEKKRC